MRTLNELIEARTKNKHELDQLGREKKELEQEKIQLDYALLEKMENEDIKRTANQFASVSINEVTVPDIEDVEEFFRHVAESGNFALLHQRVSSAAFNELHKNGDVVPGVKPKQVKRILFRAL
jgi:predicted transcriptional regulator